jgi:hypothetical protein
MQEVLCSCQAARGGIAFKASIVIIEGGGRSIPSRYRIPHLLAKARGCEQRAETKRHAVDRTEIIGLCQRATGPSARAQQSGGTIP